jgi:glycine oxidase
LLTDEFHATHRRSLREFPQFAAEIHAVTHLDIGYQCNGRIEIICDPKQYSRCSEECRADSTMCLLAPSEIQNIEPAVQCGAFGGQLCRTSAQVSISGLIAALVAACKAAGVHIAEHCAVTGLRTQGERVLALENADGQLSAAQFLVAAGAWTAQLHPALVRAAPIKPVRGQGILLQATNPLISRIIKKGKIYLVPWGRRILVGSTTEPAAGFDVSTTTEALTMLRAAAEEIVPSLAQAQLIHSWAGLRPDGPKHRPVVGPVAGLSNLFVAAGHFKTGIGMAPATAEMVAAMMSP